jgi:flagellar protein FliO/FliZ
MTIPRLTVALAAALLLCLLAAPAALAAQPQRDGAGAPTERELDQRYAEDTPVDLGAEGAARADGEPAAGGGGSIVRTIVGLAIVIGVIFGVSWVLKQVKASREERASGHGLRAQASVPLGPGRSLHLVRAGTDFVIVGVGEHGVTPIRAYTEAEARAAGLVEDDELVAAAEPEAPSTALVPVSRAAGAAAERGPADAVVVAPRARPRLGALTTGGSLDRLRAMTVRR